MTLGVLITNYNTWDLALAAAREHRRLHGDQLARILVLDDGSSAPPPPDCTTEAGIEIVRNERNLGFSATLNRGIRAIGTDLVLVFDADAFPLAPYYDVVIAAFAADPSLGILGFRTQDAAGRHTAAALPEPEVLSLVLGPSLLVQWRRLVAEDWSRQTIPTAAMVVRRAAFDAVGGFDENLRWLDVDSDFSMSLNRTSPWTLRPQDGLRARHAHGGTPISTRARVIQFHAARWYVLRKHGRIPHPRVIKALLLVRLTLEWLAAALFGRWLFGRDSARRYDKVDGRRELLGWCWRNLA